MDDDSGPVEPCVIEALAGLLDKPGVFLDTVDRQGALAGELQGQASISAAEVEAVSFPYPGLLENFICRIGVGFQVAGKSSFTCRLGGLAALVFSAEAVDQALVGADVETSTG